MRGLYFGFTWYTLYSTPVRLSALASESCYLRPHPPPPRHHRRCQTEALRPRGDNSDRVELLQLSGVDSEHNSTAFRPAPGGPAVRTEKPEEGLRPDLQLYSGSRREKNHRPAAHISGLPSSTGGTAAGTCFPQRPCEHAGAIPAGADSLRCHGDAWRPPGLCPGLRSVASAPGSLLGVLPSFQPGFALVLVN